MDNKYTELKNSKITSSINHNCENVNIKTQYPWAIHTLILQDFNNKPTLTNTIHTREVKSESF